MIVAADNLTTTRPAVRRAIEERDERLLARLVGSLVKAGAGWIDLNPGRVPAPERSSTWRFLVETAERACTLPLVIDAPDAESMETALGFCTRPAVLNFATAEPARLGPVLDLAAEHSADVIAATIDARVPATAEERLALASIIVEEASGRSIDGGRLVLDPMVMPLAMPGGEAQARAVIEFLRALPSLFDPKPRTIAALSNLTTTSAGSDASAAAAPFLAAAWGAGLDIVMMNVLDPVLAETARLCEVFSDERLFAPGEYEA
ncbi:MAG: dihydropteroate synthase [Deltaproteobacteria bacterium]|nr:dihydropteroate synthase [Deltaproteobacteria bacterium]